MEKNLYQTTLAQDVVILQTKYCIDKRVVNIISSITSSSPLNFSIMLDAFNLVVQRNDCLRLRFVKQKGELMQYFEETKKFESIPYKEFKTQEEFDCFIAKIRKKPIKYKKGVVVDPYFIKTHDNKYMVLIKVCHLVLDLYGINIIFKDLFEVYNALLNNTKLPEMPVQFETLVEKDVQKKNDEKFMKSNYEFYDNYFKTREEPYYAGLGGDNSKIWLKQKAKGHKAMKIFLVNCDTKGYCHELNKNTVTKLINFCSQNKYSPANFLFYAMNICCSKINNNLKTMLPIELCNCRGLNQEKKCAGTKAQSAACHVELNFEQSFENGLKQFIKDQMILYRHLGCSDTDIQTLLHKNYSYGLLEIYYGIAFSFVPFMMPEGLEFNIYSNEKCALPAYLGVLYDLNKQEMQIAYDVQTKIVTEQDVHNYHQRLTNILDQVIDNPQILIKDIK